MKLKAITLLLCLIVLITISVNAQPHQRIQTIGNGISLLGTTFNKMSDYLSSKGYSYNSKYKQTYLYTKDVQFGRFEYNVIYKNYKVESLMWSESIYYGRDILDELEYNGLVEQKSTKFNDANGMRTAFVTYKNIKRNLGASIISKPDVNEIIVSIFPINPNLTVKKDNPASLKQLEEEKKEKVEQAAKKTAAKNDLDKFLNDVTKGKIVLDENKQLYHYISNSHLLEGNKEISIVKDGFKTNYNEDALIKFVSQKFKDESIYFVIAKDGKLDKIESADGRKAFSVVDYPELIQCITTRGKFFLNLNDKLYETAYRYPALNIYSGTCIRPSYSYFKASKKEIQLVKDSTALLNGLKLGKTSKFCPPHHNFNPDKDLLSKEVFKHVDVMDMKSFRELTDTKSKTGNNILMAGLALSTGNSTFLLGTSDTENLFRYVENQTREIFQVTDIIDAGKLNKGGFNLLNTKFALEKFSKKEQKFTLIK